MFRRLLTAACGVLACTAANAQSVDGFAEVRAQAVTGADGFPATFIERVRPTFSAAMGKHLMFSTTVELVFVQGRRNEDEFERIITESDLGPILEAVGHTFPKDANEALGISAVADYLSVERLFLDIYSSAADIRIGRQAINWGPAFLVNPTDPFPQVLLTEPWKQRQGVNAARFTFPIGEYHQIQIVGGADDTFSNVRAAGRASFNIKGVDLAIVGAYRQEAANGLVGLTLRGTAGVGFWLEASAHLGFDQTPYEQLAVGLDYSFPVLDQLVITGQYYRNGKGIPEPQGSAALGGLAASFLPTADDVPASASDFSPFFTGRDYGMLAVALGIVPEVSINALWVQNFGDGTGLVVPTITAFPTGWLEIAFSAQVGFKLFGNGGEFSPRTEDLVVSVPVADGVDPVSLDLSGLSSTSTLTLWTRVNF